MNKSILRVTTIATLCFAALSSYAATVKSLSITSEKMGKMVPALIILPDVYEEQVNRRFPVLYLLHGAGGNYATWNQSPIPGQLADQYGIIIACPDGGITSWYLDSPIDPTFQYETFIARECVDFIDAHYRTRTNRLSRATCGFSMGGHGALYLAIRHPDRFGIATSISGGVDIRPFSRHWDLAKRLGDPAEFAENWETHTLINQAKTLKPGTLCMSFECGTNDFFIGVNRALHQQLNNDGIVHTYAEHPGAHTGIYALSALKRQAAFIADHFSTESESN